MILYTLHANETPTACELCGDAWNTSAYYCVWLCSSL